MDVKEEDKSEESKKNHIMYYKSLINTILEIQKEMNLEKEDAIKEHLSKRIEAMEKDQKRIREMFPDISKEDWDEHTN
jgi:hypothetical protein